MDEISGLFVVGRKLPLPLKSSSVKAEVQGYVVGLTSTLKYVNDGDTPVEVLFRFPVDESFAVVGMEAVIEGRKIKAEIKQKEEAKQDYRKAIASGHTAALAEEKSGDIFSISLGNLPVQAEAELHLKLIGELPIDAEGGVRFTLPAVLKPRYTPSGSIDPLAPTGGAMKGQAPAVYDFKMAVKLEGVSEVTSPTHTIIVDKDGDVIYVSLGGANTEPLKKDLVVLIGQVEPHVPKVLYELGDISKSQRSYMGAPAVMLSFFPEFKVKRAACEFIFLVDRSGSMRGSYIKSASETLVLFLKSIPPGCSFNIIGFGSRYTSLFPESVSYNQQNLEYAMRHAESLQADLGGTELLSPLKHIFGQRHLPGLSRQIFVLTDGSVSNTQFCIDEVARNSDKCRVFTFGIGSGASTALVNGLAKAGDGTAEFIKEGERMQPKVIASLKRALQPSVTDLEVEFDLPSGFEAFQAPANIPTLFNGDKVVIYGILKSIASSDTPLQSGVQGKASLKGQISDQTITHTISFDIPAPPLMGEDELESSTGFDLPVIHHLAAKSLLSDWKGGKGWASTALTQEREQESTNLSIESSVICENTAFVAIDAEQKKPIEGAITVCDVTATMAEQNLLFNTSALSSNLFRAPPPPPGGLCLASAAPVGFLGLTSAAAAAAGPPPPGGLFPASAAPQASFNFMGGGPPRALARRSINMAPPSVRGMPPPQACVLAAPPPSQARVLAAPPPSQEGACYPRFGMTAERSVDSEMLTNNLASDNNYHAKKKKKKALSHHLELPTSMKASEVLPAESLTALISLQHADGFWLLKDISEKVVKKPEAKLQCPPDLSKEIWATIIALAYLTYKYAEKQDEWELVAMKAEMWLSSQTLPSSIESLKQKAKNVF